MCWVSTVKHNKIRHRTLNMDTCRYSLKLFTGTYLEDRLKSIVAERSLQNVWTIPKPHKFYHFCIECVADAYIALRPELSLLLPPCSARRYCGGVGFRTASCLQCSNVMLLQCLGLAAGRWCFSPSSGVNRAKKVLFNFFSQWIVDMSLLSKYYSAAFILVVFIFGYKKYRPAPECGLASNFCTNILRCVRAEEFEYIHECHDCWFQSLAVSRGGGGGP